ncbi:unnamed protein product [Chironomus riparius]|uniref:Uncharacterized protein n=1 Tax=Chironomus riparius TaxID=315576 RepID=A0A9N9S7D7_9DIPT|nr:unnamed protein product [Chironomus riparius]
MKCLTSFLLIVLWTNLINSIPSTDEDYLEAVKDVKYLFGEGSGQIEPEEQPRSSTPSEELTSSLAATEEASSTDDLVQLYAATSSPEDQSTSTTEAILTTTPEDLSMYTKENLLRILGNRFNVLQTQYFENQKEILDKSKSSRDKQKLSSFTFINLFQNRFDKKMNEIKENIERLVSKRSEIETSIQEYLNEEAENAESLKEQKIILQNSKDQGCNECHGFLDDDAIVDELKNIDNKLARLENKNREEPNDAKEIQAINIKYKELIDIFEKEVQERKKKEDFSIINNMIQEKLRNYTEVIEQNLKDELISRKDFADNFLDLQKLQSTPIVECTSKPFEWRTYVNVSDTEQNGVLGGIDLDGSKVYVIRRKSGSDYNYGKVALRPSKNEAYITSDSLEINVDDYELLISNNYQWHSSETTKIAESTIPICRAKKDNLFVPGKLLKDGRCKIGFGFGVLYYDTNI